MSYVEVSREASRQSQDRWVAFSRQEKHMEWIDDQESMLLLGDRTSPGGTTVELVPQVCPLTLTRPVLGRLWRSKLSMLLAALVEPPSEPVSQQHHA